MAEHGEIWSVGSDNLVTATVWDRILEVFPSDATMVATLNDSDGNAVANAIGLSGSYKTNSQGVYHLVVPSNAAITAGNQYTLVITTTTAAGKINTKRENRLAKED